MMKSLGVFKGKNGVYLYDGEKGQEIFNTKEYKDVFTKFPNGEHNFFNKIYNEYGITNIDEIKQHFLYLFNMVLISNITSFIVDKYEEGNFEELYFDKSIEKSRTQMIRFNDLLDSENLLGGIIIFLINSPAYLENGLKIDYKPIPDKKNIDIIEESNIGTFFTYQSNNIRNFKEKLKLDLVAFGFVEKEKADEEGRFDLPIYVDYDVLVEKGLSNYEEFLPNWKSIAYLKMLGKIHEYFSKYYQLETENGLVNDDLMVALISLLGYKEEQMPKGLKKSIEVGRATAGKCTIIDTVMTPVSLPQDLALALQSKDVFSTVPKIYLSSI